MPDTAVAPAEPRALVENLAEILGSRATVQLVYADPIERAGTTVVPVARIRFGFGGGDGQNPRDSARRGSGGGGALVADPVGFLVLRGDEVTYQPIRDPLRIALAAGAIAIAASWALRAIRRLVR